MLKKILLKKVTLDTLKTNKRFTPALQSSEANSVPCSGAGIVGRTFGLLPGYQVTALPHPNDQLQTLSDVPRVGTKLPLPKNH